MKISRTLIPVLVVVATLLSGCENLGKPAQPFALYDFGLVEPAEPKLAARPASIEVRAPSWLAGAAMQYRLDYRQPAQRDAYLESRWASPPTEMLAHALERGLVAVGARTSECRLRIEIDEFVQTFSDRQSSHAEIVARAQLLPARGNIALVRETFVIREPAPTADAAGGVVAHRRAVQALTQRIAVWLSGLDPAKSQGLNNDGRCV